MKKDVLIEIKGVYRQEEDEDEIELFTTGSYYKRGGNYYIAYDESEATGFGEDTHTTLKVEQGGRVTLSRTGANRSQLIIERGVRHQCHYDTGYGAMTIGVSGDRVVSNLDEHGGALEFAYSLDVNTLLASENAVYVNVREQPAETIVQ